MNNNNADTMLQETDRRTLRGELALIAAVLRLMRLTRLKNTAAKTLSSCALLQLLKDLKDCTGNIRISRFMSVH